MVAREVMLHNARGTYSVELLYWGVYKHKKRVVHQNEREVFPSRGSAKSAVFLPGLLAYSLSEGDLWFTSDNWTIILCAHSLSVEVKKKEKNVTNKHRRVMTLPMSNARKASRLSCVVKRFGIRCKVITFQTIKETLQVKASCCYFFRTSENYLAFDCLTKMESNQRCSFHMNGAAKLSLQACWYFLQLL